VGVRHQSTVQHLQPKVKKVLAIFSRKVLDVSTDALPLRRSKGAYFEKRRYCGKRRSAQRRENERPPTGLQPGPGE
jgi:hypothetical protein